MHQKTAVAVVGAGPAGLAAALAVRATGVDVTLFAPPLPPARQNADNRTAALFAGSVELLRNLGAWEAIAPLSAPVRAIRIIDDTGGLLRAPEVVFTAEEVEREVFGWNIPNAALVSALSAGAGQPGFEIRREITQGVRALDVSGDAVRLSTAEGATFEAMLVVGADGRESLCRTAAGIATKRWPYAQAALTTSFSHTRPHGEVSTEFHRPAGPMTTVPLPGRTSSLVWVERPAEAERLASLDDAAFRSALEDRLQGLLGTIGDVHRRAVFPLSALTSESFGRGRVALVGEAAHVIPPIGAQGLNLGLRDGAVLADCIADALREGRDIGGEAMLQAYDRLRRPDVASRVGAVDVMNRALTSTLLPVHFARGLGLVALKTIGPLRRQAVREGLHPSHVSASLLQPNGLRTLADRAARAPRNSAA